MSTKNVNFSLHEKWETHGQSFIWRRITKLAEHISSKVWENCRGLESGPELGGIGGVIELAMAKQVYRKIDPFTTWLVGVLQRIWQFKLKASLKIILVNFFLVTRSIFSFAFGVSWFFCFVSLMPNVKVWSFWSELFERLIGETHVFGPWFFVYFFVMVELWICSDTW